VLKKKDALQGVEYGSSDTSSLKPRNVIRLTSRWE
jgi:hypothetical protein